MGTRAAHRYHRRLRRGMVANYPIVWARALIVELDRIRAEHNAELVWLTSRNQVDAARQLIVPALGGLKGSRMLNLTSGKLAPRESKGWRKAQCILEDQTRPHGPACSFGLMTSRSNFMDHASSTPPAPPSDCFSPPAPQPKSIPKTSTNCTAGAETLRTSTSDSSLTSSIRRHRIVRRAILAGRTSSFIVAMSQTNSCATD